MIEKNPKEAVRRRLIVASDYFDASNVLAEKLPLFSESQTLLAVTAFEVLLKALRFASIGKSHGDGHKYFEIWEELPEALRTEIKVKAANLRPGHCDFSDIQRLFVDWGKAFTKYRYSYEINEVRTDPEIATASENWVEPDFEFHPFELNSLNEAMLDWLKTFITE